MAKTKSFIRSRISIKKFRTGFFNFGTKLAFVKLRQALILYYFD